MQLGCLKQFPQRLQMKSCLLLKTVSDRADYNGFCLVGLRHWFALPWSWDSVTIGDTFNSNCVGKSLSHFFIYCSIRGNEMKQNFAYSSLQQSMQFPQQQQS